MLLNQDNIRRTNGKSDYKIHNAVLNITATEKDIGESF